MLQGRRAQVPTNMLSEVFHFHLSLCLSSVFLYSPLYRCFIYFNSYLSLAFTSIYLFPSSIYFASYCSLVYFLFPFLFVIHDRCGALALLLLLKSCFKTQNTETLLKRNRGILRISR